MDEEVYRQENGRQVAGPVLRDRELAQQEQRLMRRLKLWLAVGAVVVFSMGGWLGWTLRGDIATQISREAPCMVQAMGVAGSNDSLDTVESNSQAASAAVGAELSIERQNGYVALVGILCPKEDAADPMDQGS